MDGIPPTLPSDTEDVVWALQTAESLWKRGERVDSIVWLRRAAQAAGEAQDDVRAAMLARNAAELGDWIASHTMHGDSIEPEKVVGGDDVDDLLSDMPPPGPVSEEFVLSASHVELVSSQDFEAGFRAPSKRPASVRPSYKADGSPSDSGILNLDVDDVQLLDAPGAAPVLDAHESNAPSDLPPSSKGVSSPSGVPSAAEAHAGMLDPWAEQDIGRGSKAPKSRPSKPTPFEEEEVTTSTLPRKAHAPPPAPAMRPMPTPPKAARVPPPNVGRKPPPPRPKTDEAPTASYQKLAPKPALPREEIEIPISSTSMEILEEIDARVPTAPPRRSPIPEPISSRPFPLSKPSTRPPAGSAAPTPAPTGSSDSPTKPPPSGDVEETEEPPHSAIPPTRASNRPDETMPLGLENVEALGDLPDDARGAFEKAATIHSLAKDEEVSRFALALVVEGEIDVSSEIVDAPAMKLEKGAILRSRGTLDQGVSMRLVCASDSAKVASWNDAAVAEAFRTCPWVEEDLRVVADRVQTRVGISMGPLGERLDMDLREHIAGKLEVKSLAPGDLLVEEGKPMPILIVGVGELELTKKGAKAGVLRPGDFYFPQSILSGGSAPATARAGKGGALVLYGEHRVATELMMTFPPLMEILAS